MILFVPVALAVFALVRPRIAVLTVLLAGPMLLPEQVAFDAPGLPPTDKYSLTTICALLGTLMTSRHRLRAARLGRGIDLFALVTLAGYAGTSMTNRDVLTYGATILPALTLYDAGAGVFRAVVALFLPFFLGRALFRDSEALRDVLVALVVAAILYSPLILIEARMSPQIHRIVYGFHQHQFIQTVRAGGYRPMVFMTHGLTLAMFVSCATLAAAGLHRARVTLPMALPSGPVLAWLLLILLLMRSAAALMYGLVALGLVFLARPRTQGRVAALLTLLVLGYPMLRTSGLFPVEDLLQAAASISPERAQSLGFRFYNEDLLLEKALERWVYGWGSFGRNRIYTSWGQDVSVTDGFWVIVLGSNGAVGFIGVFGVLLAPIWMAARRLRRLEPGATRTLLGVLTLIVAVLGVDLLPNSIMSVITMLLAGALAGIAQGLGRSAAEARN